MCCFVSKCWFQDITDDVDPLATPYVKEEPLFSSSEGMQRQITLHDSQTSRDPRPRFISAVHLLITRRYLHPQNRQSRTKNLAHSPQKHCN